MSKNRFISDDAHLDAEGARQRGPFSKTEQGRQRRQDRRRVRSQKSGL